MSKEFNCPSCAEPIIFQGGESIFQTCKSCHAPVIIPSEMLYKNEQKLPSEDFASLGNDKPVDVEQVTNELTPGNGLPADDEMIDREAGIEKFEVYQNKIGTGVVEAKKAVDEIISPKKQMDFGTLGTFENSAESKNKQKILLNPVLARIQYELQADNKIEAIKIFREKFNSSLREAKDSVEAIERNEQVNFSQFLNQGDE